MLSWRFAINFCGKWESILQLMKCRSEDKTSCRTDIRLESSKLVYSRLCWRTGHIAVQTQCQIHDDCSRGSWRNFFEYESAVNRTKVGNVAVNSKCPPEQIEFRFLRMRQISWESILLGACTILIMVRMFSNNLNGMLSKFRDRSDWSSCTSKSSFLVSNISKSRKHPL